MNPNENTPVQTPVPNQTPTPQPNPVATPAEQPQPPVYSPETNPVAPVAPSFPAVNTPSNQPTTPPNPFETVNATNGMGPSSNPQQGSPSEDPGKTLGIIGLVLSLLWFGVISLILSILGRNKSKKAGHSNGFALAGIIISIITIIISIIATALLVFGSMKAVEYCQENGTTVQNADGSTTLNCSSETDTSSGGTNNQGSSTMQFDTFPEGSGSRDSDTTPVTPTTSP